MQSSEQVNYIAPNYSLEVETEKPFPRKCRASQRLRVLINFTLWAHSKANFQTQFRKQAVIKGMLMSLTHSSPQRTLAQRAATRFLHSSLSFAVFSTVLQHSWCFFDSSTVLRHLVLCRWAFTADSRKSRRLRKSVRPSQPVTIDSTSAISIA